jgi:acylphosphatase
MKGVSIRCSGKVQGVFFRVSAKNKADELGLKGWVRNEPDGTVLIHAEGHESQLEELLEWCNHGPQFARVEGVESLTVEVQKFDAFEIRQS